MEWSIEIFPPQVDLETKKILKALPGAHRALAELKGVAQTIPNQAILLNTLPFQEAKDSSAIENIITTHDEIFKSSLRFENIKSFEAKEIQNYEQALKKGFVQISKKVLTNNDIISIQQELEGNNAGFRKVPGTSLKNPATQEIIYTPPQDFDSITLLMSNLERFINNDTISDLDPLIKMAIIHFQFESIHPFYDGNGRTGRIINILFLALSGLLELPILYLSRYIIENKTKYYQLLQKVRDSNEWEEWVLFMIQAVEQTSQQTIHQIIGIRKVMMKYKQKIRSEYKFYSQDLLNNLFKHPYTKIEFLVDDLKISRITAANYLNQLAQDGYLDKQKLGTGNYYINVPLFNLLLNPDKVA
ncbi:MAG: Fic family protein [Cyclobacteriaceae bacterium]